MTGQEITLLVLAALLASTIAAVTGTGGGVILLPVMTLFFGVRDRCQVLSSRKRRRVRYPPP